MSTTYMLRKAARNNLKKKWYIGSIITIISFFIGVYSFGPLPSVAIPTEEWLVNPMILLTNWNEIFCFDIRTVRNGLFYLLGAAGVLGNCYCYLLMAEGKPCSFRDLFHCYPQIIPAIGLRILRFIYTFFGLSAFIIPGIYIHYVYSLSPWIMADNCEIGVRQALLESRRMMKGNKLRMFMLDISFAGWFVLCIISLGIGLILFIPYYNSARAVLYKEIKESKVKSY